MDLVSITFGLHAYSASILHLLSNVDKTMSWFFLSVSDDFIRFGHALSIKTPYGHVKTECRATPSLFCSAKIYPSPDIISGFSQDMDHLGSSQHMQYGCEGDGVVDWMPVLEEQETSPHCSRRGISAQSDYCICQPATLFWNKAKFDAVLYRLKLNMEQSQASFKDPGHKSEQQVIMDQYIQTDVN
ncbi:hypothetical protein F2P79_021465 [Pimephales promelas]|nr:hypothetical protein F2P79_021465 [Pimephales promelas]